MRKSLLILALLSAAFTSPALAADAVARVGGVDVTTDDVRAWLGTLSEADQDALAKNPQELSQMVRQYLVLQQVLKEAREKKFDQQADVKTRLEQMKDAALLELYLQSVAKIPEEFPSEAELQAAYDANKSAFVASRQYRLAQIFIAVPKGNNANEDKAKSKLDAATKNLKGKGADFASIAKEFSDTGADKGGDLGWLPETQIVPEIRQVVAGLAKDGVSEPIRMDDGWHILKLIETKPAGAMPLSEVRETLKERLRQVKSQQLRQAYLAQLTSQHPIILNELALNKITLKK